MRASSQLSVAHAGHQHPSLCAVPKESQRETRYSGSAPEVPYADLLLGWAFGAMIPDDPEAQGVFWTVPTEPHLRPRSFQQRLYWTKHLHAPIVEGVPPPRRIHSATHCSSKERAINSGLDHAAGYAITLNRPMQRIW